MLSRAEMEAAIAAGGGVLIGDRIVTRVEDLPPDAPEPPPAADLAGALDVLRDADGAPADVPQGDLAADLTRPATVDAPEPASRRRRR